MDALGRKRFEASHSKSDKSADATFDPRVPKCHIRIRTSLQMRHFPACPKVSHSKSDKSADAGDDALTKDLEREVSDHSYHFRGL